MMSRIHILFIAMIAAATLFAEPTERYIAGNKAYRAGDFAAAIEAYNSAIAEGAADARVYYNLGNAYYRTDSIGKAVLAYERARFLSPRNEDVLRNLDFVTKTRVDIVQESGKNGGVADVYENTPLGVFYGLLEKVSFRELARASALFTIFGTLLLFIALIIKGRARSFFKITAIVAWSIALLILVPYAFKRTRIWETDKAVVVAPKVEIRSAPSGASQLKYRFREGMEVAVKEVRGSSARVLLRNGEEGWLDLDGIERVIPQK